MLRFSLPRNGYQDNKVVLWIIDYWDQLTDDLHKRFDLWSLITAATSAEVDWMCWLFGLQAIGLYSRAWPLNIRFQLCLDALGYVLPNRGTSGVLQYVLRLVVGRYNPTIFVNSGLYAEITPIEATLGNPEYDLAVLLPIESYNDRDAWKSADLICDALVPAVTRWIVCLDHFYADYSRAGDLVLDE
jgi:hypothetical protein